MIGPEPGMGVLSHVKEPDLSGLGQWGLTQRIGDIKHKVQRSTQQLCQSPDGTSKAKGLEPSQSWWAAVGDDFLGVPVGPFTGGASPREPLPPRGAST